MDDSDDGPEKIYLEDKHKNKAIITMKTINPETLEETMFFSLKVKNPEQNKTYRFVIESLVNLNKNNKPVKVLVGLISPDEGFALNLNQAEDIEEKIGFQHGAALSLLDNETGQKIFECLFPADVEDYDTKVSAEDVFYFDIYEPPQQMFNIEPENNNLEQMSLKGPFPQNGAVNGEGIFDPQGFSGRQRLMGRIFNLPEGKYILYHLFFNTETQEYVELRLANLESKPTDITNKDYYPGRKINKKDKRVLNQNSILNIETEETHEFDTVLIINLCADELSKKDIDRPMTLDPRDERFIVKFADGPSEGTVVAQFYVPYEPPEINQLNEIPFKEFIFPEVNDIRGGIRFEEDLESGFRFLGIWVENIGKGKYDVFFDGVQVGVLKTEKFDGTTFGFLAFESSAINFDFENVSCAIKNSESGETVLETNQVVLVVPDYSNV